MTATQDLVVAGKPAYVAVIDTDTGAVKFDLRYHVTDEPEEHWGRPYGLLQAADIDGDGYRDVILMSVNVEQYIAVLHNKAGTALEPAWSQYIDRDYPADIKDIHIDVSSLTDLNHDGRKELAISLYDETGDNAWHTVVIAADKGFHQRSLDQVDHDFHGCYDVNGDGRKEIITSITCSRNIEPFGRVEIIDPADGTVIAAMDDLAFFTGLTILPDANESILPTINNGASIARAWSLLADGRSGIVVTQKSHPDALKILTVRNGTCHLQDIRSDSFAKALLTHSLVTNKDPVNHAPHFSIAQDAQQTVTGVLLTTCGPDRQLVLSTNDDQVLAGTPDLTRPGRFKTLCTLDGTKPAAWIGNAGSIICTMQDDAHAVTVNRCDDDGTYHSIAMIKLPMPFHPYVHLMPYTDHQQFRLFVGLKSGRSTLGLRSVRSERPGTVVRSGHWPAVPVRSR